MNEKLREVFSEAGHNPDDLYKAVVEERKAIRVSFPSDTHTFPMHLNGRLTYVTVPISISVPEAMKAIQDAEEAQKGDPSLIMRIAPAVDKAQELLARFSALSDYLNEDSQPVPKPKQRHDWYKFNDNKYGRK